MAEGEQQSKDGSLAGDVQVLILQELRRVSKRLDVVEEQLGRFMASTVTSSGETVPKLSKHIAHESCTVLKKSKKKWLPLEIFIDFLKTSKFEQLHVLIL